MDDYPISKEAAVRELINLRDRLGGPIAKEVLNMALSRLEGFPQMDAVPVVHGRWVHFKQHDLNAVFCNVCDYAFARLHPANYCPNCGAKMDGGAEG